MGQVKLTTGLWTPLLLLLLVLSLTWSDVASAAPLWDERTGGLGLSGPASAHPASFLYNPAALGLQPGRLIAVYVDGTLRLGHGTYSRRSIDTLTGDPTSAGGTTVKDFDDERLLELFPQPMVAISSSLGSDKVVLSLSTLTAHTQRVDFMRGDGGNWFDGASQGPTRYVATELTQYHLFNNLTASWQVADFLIIGASFRLVWGYLDLGFVRDTALDGGTVRDAETEPDALDDCGAGVPCNYESDDAAEATRVAGSAWGLGFSVGIVVRPHPSVDVGVGYVSRVLGTDGGELAARGAAWVERSRATYLSSLSDPNPVRSLEGRGTLFYALPDAVNLGVTWRITRRWLLDLQLRWVNYSVNDRISLRLSGSMFRRKPSVPERIDQYRGFQDVWAAQVGGAFRVRDNLDLQSALMLETSAAPSDLVTPVTVDATKLDLMLALAWHLGAHVTLRAGYTLGWMPTVDQQTSRYSPSLMVNCVDARYDIDLRDCKASSDGLGMPSTAGSYSLLTHRFGTSVTFHLQ